MDGMGNNLFGEDLELPPVSKSRLPVLHFQIPVNKWRVDVDFHVLQVFVWFLFEIYGQFLQHISAQKHGCLSQTGSQNRR